MSGECGKDGGHYRDEEHVCLCAVPKATKHLVHQCECKAGWVEKR